MKLTLIPKYVVRRSVGKELNPSLYPQNDPIIQVRLNSGINRAHICFTPTESQSRVKTLEIYARVIMTVKRYPSDYMHRRINSDWIAGIAMASEYHTP